MYELLPHTSVMLVAEPNLPVLIVSILPKLCVLVLRNLAVWHETVDDYCSPHLLHLQATTIINKNCRRAYTEMSP